MKESLEELTDKLKSGEVISDLVVKMSLKIARDACKQILELMDEYLLQTKDKCWKVERIRSRLAIFTLGGVRFRRRQYLDQDGNLRYLLDEYLGLEGKSPLTPELKESGAFLTTLLPFMKCEQVMNQSLLQASVSHTTLHRNVKRITESWLQAEDSLRKRTYDTGDAPVAGERAVPRLLIEADGVNIALQRERQRKAEIKVGIAYEGWEEVSRERYRLTGKTSYCALTSGDRFWEGFSLQLAARYDFTRASDIVVGGDGAGWVKTGADLLGGYFQLDRFHLLRALRRALSWQTNLIKPVYAACNEGNWLTAHSILRQALQTARGTEKEEILRLIRYLSANIAGLKDRPLDTGKDGTRPRRTGAIESNVDKLVANRMKKKGMSWTLKGARHMACLLMLSAEHKLTEVCRPSQTKVKGKTALKKQYRILVKNIENLEGKWLQASIPALYGPHQNRHWVKTLKHFSEVSLNV